MIGLLSTQTRSYHSLLETAESLRRALGPEVDEDEIYGSLEDWIEECRRDGESVLAEMQEAERENDPFGDGESEGDNESYEEDAAEDLEPDRGYLEDREDDENVDTHTESAQSTGEDDEGDDNLIAELGDEDE